MNKAEFMLAMGRRVKAQREAIGLSQHDLAVKLGYANKSSISYIESGDREIPQSKMPAFAAALNTTIEYLMGWENVPRSRNETFTREEIELVMCFRRADERDRNTVRYILERYKEDTASSVG